MRSLFATWGWSAVLIVSTIFRSCSMWLCFRLWSNADGAVPGLPVRKTAVPLTQSRRLRVQLRLQQHPKDRT